MKMTVLSLSMNTVKLFADKVRIKKKFCTFFSLSDTDVKQVERAKEFLGSDR